MGISRTEPFFSINSARSSFHSLFHAALCLPCRCCGILSFQVFRYNFSGLTQRQYISFSQFHFQKFIISTLCLMIRLTFHASWRMFPRSRPCGSGIMSWATEEPLQETPLAVSGDSYPGLAQAESYMVSTKCQLLVWVDLFGFLFVFLFPLICPYKSGYHHWLPSVAAKKYKFFCRRLQMGM